MIRSSRHKEKHGKSSETLKDYYHEETAARTRPLSFDEIMSTRKNKNKVFDSEKEGVAEDVLGDGNTGKLLESGNGRSKDGTMEKVPDRGDGRSEDRSTGKVLERSNVGGSKDRSTEKVSEWGDGRRKDRSTERVSERVDGQRKDRSSEKVLERGNGRSDDGNTERILKRDNGRSKYRNTERVSERDYGRRKDGNLERVSERDYGRSKDGNLERVSEREYIRSKDGNTKRVSEREYGRSKDGNTERVAERENGRSKYGTAERVSEREYGRSKDGNTERVSEREYGRSKDEYTERVSKRDNGQSKEGITEKVSKRDNRRSKDVSSGVEKHFLERDAKANSKKKEERSASTKDNYFTKSKETEILGSESKVKDKMGRDLKAKGNSEENIHDRRKNDDRRSNDVKNETSEKRSRHLTERDRHVDGSRGNSERENKRKYQDGVDEKDTDRYPTWKYDLGKGHDSETLDRKERKESLNSNYEEIKMKSKRSRSREHSDRKRRSISPLPRSQKRLSHHGREHGELSSHSLKETSGEKHSDIDRNKVMNNGSGGHSKRHGGSTSGLGGYSPRKRRTDAAARTPSPTKHSPEKKRAKWDLAPEGADNVSSMPVPPNFQLSNQIASSNTNVTVSVVPVSSIAIKPLSGVSSSILSTYMNYAIDAVQLTEATRPVRRLYVENIPTLSSEKAVMEYLNNLLISSGVNHIQGTQPCISCIIHKEKGQALVEFLTPEDASMALSFDGSSFSGSTIKIRRPKDFVEMATGEPEKSVAAVDAINKIVKDSPQKIFIGGISKVLSSEMILEIASTFGQPKAYHIENSNDFNELHAFVEYADQSVASKACASLNGMKLGGQIISAVQVPNASTLENDGDPPTYEVPEQARPFLNKPTPVLKLKNVFDPEELPSLSHTEIEEALEDVRLECARFGTVKSVNIVKCSSTPISISEACEGNADRGSAETRQNPGVDETSAETETIKEAMDHNPVEGNGLEDDKPADDLIEDESCQHDRNMDVGNLSGQSFPESQEVDQQNLKDESDCTHSNVIDNIEMDTSMEDKLVTEEDLISEEVGGKVKEAFVDDHVIGSHMIGKEEHKEKNFDVAHVFEPGCIFVEFRQTESSCMAAHCLHGRLFDNRTVAVEYVPVDIYQSRFPK